MKDIIEINKLTKKYPKFTLDNINLDIPSGKIIGLIGENGAGKTTLIKSILNIIKFDGDIKIFGKDNIKEEKVIKEDIGVVLDNSFFPELLTPNDIKLIMKNIYKSWDNIKFDEYLSKFNLPSNQSIKTLSKGMRKKLEIITALSHNPKLLILDEPTSGLDPVVRNEILEIFEEFITDTDHAILLSTHITSDLEHIADDIIFIDGGKLIFNLSKKEILKEYGIIKCDESEYKILDKEDIIRKKTTKNGYEVLINKKSSINKKYNKLKILDASLEDIMVLYIKGEE